MPRVLRGREPGIHLRSAPQMREYAAIADRIAADRPGRVLDWGACYGQLTRLLHDRGVDVVPYDYRPGLSEQVEEPLREFPAMRAVLTSEPVALPFPDDSFASVLSCGVLEHVQDPDGSLEELKRVLRPGGTLYIYKLPNRHSYLEWIARTLARRGARLFYHGLAEHDRLYDLRSARELLERHGYVVRELRYSNMLPLGLPGRAADLLTGPIWAINRCLARVPGLRLLATNVDGVAQAPSARS